MSYTVRHGITGTIYGKPYATRDLAEKAAINVSNEKRNVTIDLILDDGETPARVVAYAYQGELTAEQ
jgi:hypothetical protein